MHQIKTLPKEEWANVITHGIGLCLSLIGFIVLIVVTQRHDDALHMISCGIFGGSLVLLYAASTLYHSFQSERLKHFFKIVDHCAIYLLIAGTYTPFTLLVLEDVWGQSLFCIIWSLAVIGILFKLFFVNKFKVLSTLIYLLMGWLVLFAIEPLVVSLSYEGLCWLISGGIFYSAGVIFFINEKPRFNHAIWHLFVLGGSICHFVSVFLYVLP